MVGDIVPSYPHWVSIVDGQIPHVQTHPIMYHIQLVNVAYINIYISLFISLYPSNIPLYPHYNHYIPWIHMNSLFPNDMESQTNFHVNQPRGLPEIVAMVGLPARGKSFISRKAVSDRGWSTALWMGRWSRDHFYGSSRKIIRLVIDKWIYDKIDWKSPLINGYIIKEIPIDKWNPHWI